MHQSPCATCDHHLAGGDKNDPRCWACKKTMPYWRSYGDMNESMKIHMTTWGKDFTPPPPPPPLIPGIMPGAASCAMSDYSPPRTHKCRYYGCKQMVSPYVLWCVRCSVRIRNRMGERGKSSPLWPEQFLYAPVGWKRVVLLDLEAKGKLSEQPWYIAAVKDSEAGLFKKIGHIAPKSNTR